MSTHRADDNLMNRGNRTALLWLAVGAILAATGVGLGAFGAHGLQNVVEGKVTDVQKSLEYWGTANRYLMYHSFGIMAVSLASLSLGFRRSFWICNGLFVAGIVLFSGCLYVMALTDLKPLGAVVPLGGLSLIIAWSTFAIGLFFAARNGNDNGKQ